jgi:uncharacterized membrane protein
MVVLTPPFQVPDEQEHFHRAYQLSEFQLRGVVQDGLAGGVLPSSLIELSEHFLGTRDIHPMWSPMRQPWRSTWLARERPLDPERREFVDFTSTAFYSPLGYLPQAVAMIAGRWAGAGPLALLYLARFANALVAVGLLTCAVRLMPIASEVVIAAGLLPMAVFEYASAAPDALVIATAFLFTAVALRSQLVGSWTAGEVVIAAASGLILCSQKPVYAPLLFLAFPALLTRRPVKQTLLGQAVILVVALGGTAFWIGFSWSGAVLPYPGISVTNQANFIAMHPLLYAVTIVRSFWYLGLDYFLSLIGKLGWMTLYLPKIVCGLAASALLLSVLAQPQNSPRLPAYAAVWNVFILGSDVVLMMTAVYLSWTAVGFWLVTGVQGRYFLPLLPLFLATVCSAFGSRPFRGTSRIVLSVVVPAIIAVDLLIADITMVRAFQIF